MNMNRKIKQRKLLKMAHIMTKMLKRANDSYHVVLGKCMELMYKLQNNNSSRVGLARVYKRLIKFNLLNDVKCFSYINNYFSFLLANNLVVTINNYDVAVVDISNSNYIINKFDMKKDIFKLENYIKNELGVV